MRKGAKNQVFNLLTGKYRWCFMLALIFMASLSIGVDKKAFADDSITITLPSSSLDLSLTPTSSGTFSSTSMNVQVTTSNTAGYTLSMTAASTNLTRTAAVNETTPIISTLLSSYSESAFPTGYWGYKLSSDSNYSPISASRTTLVDVNSSTANTAISNIITFAAKLDNSKPAGSYTTTLTFIATGKLPPEPLYNKVEALALQKGGGSSAVTQSRSDLQAVITTANSGVYQYNSSLFGTASDVNNGYNIYYYRGILDSNLDGTSSTYGSNGDGVTWPNYVKLGDTCWRIFRTTASGGVKMIYNGSYSGGTTANSCANAQANAQLTTEAFNIRSATIAGTSYTGLQYQNIHAVGYTYSSVAASTTTYTALSTLFGSSGNDTTTNTNNSIIKQYIESWYSSNMTSYTSMLEPNANYCADRTVYNDGSYAIANKLAESTTVKPYGTSGMTIYRFGAFARNMNTAQNPTLTCPRGIVDNYSTTTASGGNGQLNYPVALLTADEASFSGSGNSTATNGSAYHYNSFLRSGSNFWLLSPLGRTASGYAVGFALYSNGNLGGNNVNVANGVRPVVSISHETNVTGGTGTATDPWTVE